MAEKLTLAKPYALAAFDYANSVSKLLDWQGMLEEASLIIQTNEPNVEKTIRNPRVTKKDKEDFFRSFDCFNEEFMNFIKLLIEKERLVLIPEILILFKKRKSLSEKKLEINIISAYEMNDSQQKNLQSGLEKYFDKKVNLSIDVDKSLIGGALIKNGDFVIDRTVKVQLSRMAETLLAS